MSNSELKQMRVLCIILKNFIKYHKLYYFKHCYNNLLDIIDIIDSDLSNEKKSKLIIEKYKNLYPPHNGLDECYVFDNNFEMMKEINAPFGEAQDKAWDIMRKYV